MGAKHGILDSHAGRHARRGGSRTKEANERRRRRPIENGLSLVSRYVSSPCRSLARLRSSRRLKASEVKDSQSPGKAFSTKSRSADLGSAAQLPSQFSM